jgi:hypothetical protein
MANNTGVCEICGRTIVLTAFDVCWNCREQRLNEIDRILTFIKEHRNANLLAVAEATGVDPQLVLRLMRKGTLQVKKGGETLHCEGCRRPISSGRFCDKCAGYTDPSKVKKKKK